MSQRIDDEIERLMKLGQTPKTIYIGNDLYFELSREINPTVAASVVQNHQEAPVVSEEDVTEYKEIPVKLLDDVASDYLSIET